MKLHFHTDNTELYSFDSVLEIMDDDEFFSLCQNEELESILNGDEVIDSLNDYFAWDESNTLLSTIDALFDKSTNGIFDWVEKTSEYYELFHQMLKYLRCDLIKDDNTIIKIYQCEFDDMYNFKDSICFLCLANFYSGNGEPIGAQLALDMVEVFMREGKWHIGFFDSDNNLISDISAWAENHILDISTIKPIVWFGNQDDIAECWSITPDTADSFVREFWGDYFEGALPYICKACEGLGIYYSVWEYGLDYDSGSSIFEDIKSSCPINLDLSCEDRTKALYHLVASIYNENKA